MTSQSQIHRAYTNIALIKYWGKRNPDLFLPMTSSLSLTLQAFYTQTQIESVEGTQDSFILNGQLQDAKATAKVSRFLDRFRDLTGQAQALRVKSYNQVPTAAGLASSASAFAALACAANDYFKTDMDRQTLSTYARQGSGSACRSLFGGFVLWHQGQGDDSDSSYSQTIDAADWDIGMVVILIDTQAKKISSRQGMQDTMASSPFYKMWPETVAEDLAEIIPAIHAQDLIKVGEIAEHNAMKMHATMLGARPSFTYWQPESIIAMQAVRQLRETGIPCYFTMDAGPNVKVICRLSQADQIQEYLSKYFPMDRLIITGPGPGPHPVDQVTLDD